MAGGLPLWLLRTRLRGRSAQLGGVLLRIKGGRAWLVRSRSAASILLGRKGIQTRLHADCCHRSPGGFPPHSPHPFRFCWRRGSVHGWVRTAAVVDASRRRRIARVVHGRGFRSCPSVGARSSRPRSLGIRAHLASSWLSLRQPAAWPVIPPRSGQTRRPLGRSALVGRGERQGAPRAGVQVVGCRCPCLSGWCAILWLKPFRTLSGVDLVGGLRGANSGAFRLSGARLLRFLAAAR